MLCYICVAMLLACFGGREHMHRDVLCYTYVRMFLVWLMTTGHVCRHVVLHVGMLLAYFMITGYMYVGVLCYIHVGILLAYVMVVGCVCRHVL